MCSMALLSKRFTGLIVVIISVLLALTASGFFYYIQINENESYQNQLHFRELNEVTNALGKGLKQLATVAEEDSVAVLINKKLHQVKEKTQLIEQELFIFDADTTPAENEISNTRQKIATLEKERSSRQINKTIEQIEVEDSYVKKITNIESSIQEKTKQLLQKQRASRELERQYEDYIDLFIGLINTFDEQDLDDIGEQCDLGSTFCQWFENLIDNYLTLEPYQDVEIANLKETILAKLENVVTEANNLLSGIANERNSINSISRLLKKGAYQLSNEPELKEKFSCSNTLIWPSPLICERLIESLSDYNHQQQTRPSRAPSTKKAISNVQLNTVNVNNNDIKVLQQQVQHSRKINALKNEILQHFIAQLKAPTTREKLIISTTKIKQLNQEIETIITKRETALQTKSEIIKANDTALSNLDKEITKKLNNLRSNVLTKQAYIVQKNLRLIEQLRVYENELFPRDKNIIDDAKDFHVFYNNLQSAFKQLVDCIEDYSTSTNVNCDNKFNDVWVLTKPQTLQKLLQSSTYLKNADIKTTILDDFTYAYNLRENQFNLFSSPNEKNRLVAYWYQKKNKDKEKGKKPNQRSLTTVPLVDLLGTNIARFPLILLVDKKGKRLVRKENSILGSFQHGLNFDLTTQILKKLARQQNAENEFFQTSDQQIKTRFEEQATKNDSTQTNEQIETSNISQREALPGYSGYIDVNISGQEYRVFASPYQTNFFDADNNQQIKTLYILGFITKSALVSKKLTISNTAVMISILCLLMLMAIAPLLKIRLISVQQSFSLADRHWAFIGLGALAGILAIAVFDHTFYNHLKKKIDNQSRTIHQEIKHNFKHEIIALTKYAKNNIGQITSINAKQNSSYEQRALTEQTINDVEHVQPKNSNALFNDRWLSETGTQYFLENLFTLGTNGLLNDSALWSTKQLYRKKEIDLNARDYFNKAIRCDAWPVFPNNKTAQVKTKKETCQNQLFIQRIFNVRDSRKTTQMSTPFFDNITNNEQGIMSFGTRMQSFFAPLLPKHFGFLVFNNADGEVLYHSNDERSLIENIYVETDNNPKLLKLVSNAKLTNEENSFTSSYRGKTHHFRVGRLAKNIPWTLAVFYDKSQLRTLNMLTVFTAIACFLILSLITYILIAIFTSKQFVERIFWFNKKTQENYQVLAIALTLASILQITCYILLEKFFPELHSLVVFFVMLAFSLLTIWALQQQLVSSPLKASNIDQSTNADTNHGCKSYNFYVLALLIYCFATPAVLLCMSSAGYYLEKHAVVHAVHLNKSQQQAREKHQNYYDLMIDKDSPFSLNSDQLSCYLGVTETPENSSSAITCDSKNLAGTEFWFGKLIAVNKKSNINNNNIFDLIWHIIPLNFPFAQETWFLSSLEEAKFEWSVQFTSKHNRILLNALWDNFHWSLVSVLLSLALLFWLITGWLSQRLIGTNVPINFRLDDNSKQKANNKLKLFFKHLAIEDQSNHQGRFIQIIRPTQQLFQHLSSDENNPYFIDAKQLYLTTEKAIAVSEITNTFQSIEQQVESLLKVNSKSLGQTIIIKKLEMIALDPQQRLRALDVIEYIVELGNINIILLADITPLYRLTKQVAYPSDLTEKGYATSHETIRWSRLMKRFVKYYDWTPAARTAQKPNCTSEETLKHEAISWPECQQLQQDFVDYHIATKLTDLKQIGGKFFDQKNNEIPHDKANSLLIDSINQHWSSEQVIEFFSANSGASYRYRWELCTKAERLLLIQLASGYSPNPLNLEPLEHLIRRGYIYQDNGWHLVNNSFKHFILSAENDSVVATWLGEAMESNWQYVRIPLFTIVLVAVGVLAYSASEAVESLMAILTGVLSITPLLLRSFNLFKGGGNVDNS